MKCLNCRAKLAESWGYCPGCGASANLSRCPDAYTLSVSIDIFTPKGEFFKSLTCRQKFGTLSEMREAVADKAQNGGIIDIPEEVGPGYIISIDIPEHPYNYPHLVIL